VALPHRGAITSQPLNTPGLALHRVAAVLEADDEQL